MTKFQAEIDVMPKKEILDPQGKAVTGSMKNLGLAEIQNVRIGKHITLELEADSAETAHSKVDEACKNLLANLIMESYTFKVVEV
ncbi:MULTISPECIES: phosphoribosylformylglycinamidine synthase subunit PurS [Mucilaginibacter]|jgi:phosphoribosylformylglycinamidine synthase|uniref:Phosphoribosylformylglycinamidine synthase subunit PurS n=1 Tax=Mucilaginibacter ginsenosidivorax TaxID=862126 RepID=A0A5B8VV29_9SPHI|nr:MULTISPECIES: phosphoribosylformylglycinamidine synthase subunit PurS [Mucilaginibacter]QEC74981.1 phosphoribosylformylglycinamidine synthase subunit PurS [Mucilaginibacter ginsenosidivorax]SEO72699.1 phosphoribosylformylglycinamidine synthase [Mucilaginibacter sp. OK283]